MKYADEISMRILSVLADSPRKEFYQREIARLANISVGAASQKLRQLSSNGLVKSRSSGRMIFYQYNLRDPVAKQLKRLLNVETLHDTIGEIADYAERVVLFGTYAEGTNEVTNDVDIFILTDDSKKVEEIVRAFAHDSGRKVSPIILNTDALKQLRSEDKSLYKRINRGLVLWEVNGNLA